MYALVLSLRRARVMLVYVVIAIPSSLIDLAVVLAVIRANKDDLPVIVRALMRMGHDDDHRKRPPSLPRP
jgi:hypothetical protein